MIQLNLLPSIKAEYVNAQRTKRSVVTVSVIVAIVSVVLVGLLASVAYGAQNFQLNKLEDDITKSSNKLESVKDLDKILTIQSQLNVLTSLHDAKPVMSRVFTYIQQTTPADVSIDTLKVSNTDLTWAIDGKAKSLEQINKYVDTLKFTEIFQGDENNTKVMAFDDVVLSSFSSSDTDLTYSIRLKFNDQLFSSAKPEITLVVPAITTTRSQTQLPSSDVFAPNPDTTTGGEQ